MGCGESSHVCVEATNKRPVSVAIVGLRSSGKSSIVEAIKGEYVCLSF